MNPARLLALTLVLLLLPQTSASQTTASIIVIQEGAIIQSPPFDPGTLTLTFPPPPPIVLEIQSCRGNSSQLIGQRCTPDGLTLYYNSVGVFESQVLASWLQARGLPADQTQFYNNVGRDLRKELAGYLGVQLENIVRKSPSTRTQVEQDVYAWFAAWLRKYEADAYNFGYAEYSRFLRNPCTFRTQPGFTEFTPDSTNCSRSAQLFAQPSQPPAEYYISYGAKESYGKITSDKNVQETVAAVANYGGAAISAGLIGGAAAAAVTYTNFAAWFPFAVRAALDVGQGVASGLTAGAASAGPFFIVSIAIAILTKASIDVANRQKVNDGVAAFVSQYNYLRNPNNQLDVLAIFNDSSQRWKIAALQGYLFTLNSERTAPAFRAGTDLVFRSSLWRANNNSFNTVGSDSYSDGVTVLDWKLRQWKVQIFGGYFVKTCLAGTSSDPCYPAQMTASLETFHPEGGSFKGTVKALISRFENRFLVTYPEAGGRSDCPVDLNTGLSTQAQPFLTCSSYTTDAPLLLSAISGTPNTPSETYDYSAARMVFPPTFSSPDSVGFVSSAARTFNFSATSNVAPGATLNPPSGPTVAYSRGACPGSGGLPADNLPTGTGINFRAGTNLTNPAPGLVYDPNGATIPAGTYNVNVCAQILPPLGPRRSQALAVRVGSQTSILSQTNLVVFSGIPFSRKIYASGNPTPSLSVENLTINDPFRFVNFRDDGDGSATVFGTLPYPFQLLTALCIPPSIFGPGTCPIVRAENGVSSDTERFNVTAVLAPTPTLVIPPDIEFVSGAPNSVTFLGINSATTPVLTMGPAASTISLAIPGVRNSNLAPTQPLPGAPWLTYRDLGNGSGVLSGTPPAETNTDLGLQITGDAQYVIQAKANFNVAVRPLPRFLTGENAFFTVGQAATPFPIRVANNATFSLDSSNLPQGFSLAWQSQRSLELRGNPSQLTGSGGQYFLPITAGNASGTDTQTVNVYVLEAPGLFTNTPVQQNLTLHAGVTTNIRMDSSGYPKAPPIAGSPAQLGTGMVLTKTQDTMPAGSFTLLSADPAVPNVTLHGGGILRFTPPAALRGNFTLQFRAVNGIGNPSLLTLNLRVVGAGDVNADGVTNCADVSLVRGSFGKRNGVTGYDVRADVNLDGIVDVRDLSLVSSKITPGTVCQ